MVSAAYGRQPAWRRELAAIGRQVEEMGHLMNLQPWMLWSVFMTALIGGGYLYVQQPASREFLHQQWGLILGAVIGWVAGVARGKNGSRG